jgi:hypothetical protein
MATLPAALLAIATPARGDVGETIILRCTHNQSLSGFSQHAYDHALKEMTADVREYSPCAYEIQQAQLAAAVQRGSSSSNAAAHVAVSTTPSEQRALAHAAHAGPGVLEMNGRTVRPGVVRVDIASVLRSMPLPLLSVVAFLAACPLLFVAGALRRRVRTRRPE